MAEKKKTRREKTAESEIDRLVRRLEASGIEVFEDMTDEQEAVDWKPQRMHAGFEPAFC